MVLQYFVTAAETGETVPVDIDKSTVQDLAATKEDWQSGGPIMLMIADNAALSLFNTYLS